MIATGQRFTLRRTNICGFRGSRTGVPIDSDVDGHGKSYPAKISAESAAGLYGDLQGIAGRSLLEIDGPGVAAAR